MVGFEVRHHRGGGEGYDISVGVGKTFHARNIQEVIYALSHYFQQNIPEYTGDINAGTLEPQFFPTTQRFDMNKHREHAKVCDCCPLCRE